jgi:hypothetical protein
MSHVAINIYFFLKQKFAGGIKNTPAASEPSAGAAAAFCTAIILTIVSFNFYGLVATTYHGAQNGPDLELQIQAAAQDSVAAADLFSVIRPAQGNPQKKTSSTASTTIE